ncbi:MAG: NAD(P)-dependent oxidoreductase [Elusimicrobia bacterium]|nr:NAD(P)-dependent oxidoreductase [Elusimicrobiota bacterium]
MTGFLQERSYNVTGLDCNYYKGCEFLPQEVLPFKQILKDIRDINESDLEGIDVVVHLAALSNDPLGELNPSWTDDINVRASVKLANLAKKAGVEKFIFSSSCSIYGIAPPGKALTEEDEVNPVTAYAKAKIKFEKELFKLADSRFHPVFMRNATVYGLSPMLRLGLVVNNLVAWAYCTGKVAIMSDGTPWRPIIHILDFCRAFLTVIEAPAEKIHNQVFNVGRNKENYQVKDIARYVQEIVPNCRIEILNQTGSDERTYRVDFSKIEKVLPQFKPCCDVHMGIEELYRAYKDNGLTKEDLMSNKYFRVRWIKNLIEAGKVDSNLKKK